LVGWENTLVLFDDVDECLRRQGEQVRRTWIENGLNLCWMTNRDNLTRLPVPFIPFQCLRFVQCLIEEFSSSFLLVLFELRHVSRNSNKIRFYRKVIFDWGLSHIELLKISTSSSMWLLFQFGLVWTCSNMTCAVHLCRWRPWQMLWRTKA
jgi:hypothetical protein